MSRSPSGTSVCSRSPSKAWRRWARIAPRRWIPTSATADALVLRSDISWAIRTSARATSSSPRTILPSFIVSFLASRDRIKGASATVSTLGDALHHHLRAALSSRTPTRPADQLRGARLDKGKVDRVEVAGCLGCSEQGACLFAQIATRVATGDVRERKQSHAGIARDLRSLTGGAVTGLARPLGLFLGESGLVHEQISFMCGNPEGLARRGIAGDHDLATLARGSHHLLRGYSS